MTDTYKQLGQAQLASGSQTTIYTVGASTVGILKHITICNVNSSERTVEIWIVPNGQSVGDAYLLIASLTIPGNGVLTWDGFIPMETAGDTLRGEASAASSLTATVGGMEQT